MKTVMDVIRQNQNASIVLVERHESYLMGPLLARVPNKLEATARNYAELEHPSTFLLDFEGINRAHKQGCRLAREGIKVEEIIGSEQGRGPDTGLRISEGYFMKTGEWIPFRCDPAINYMVYNYGPVLRLLRTVGDPFVAHWLNGEYDEWDVPVVRSETRYEFKKRVMRFIETLLYEPGVRIITTHFEILTLVHALKVEGKRLGLIRGDWLPEKGGGVIIVRRHNDGTEEALVYDRNLNIVE